MDAFSKNTGLMPVSLQATEMLRKTKEYPSYGLSFLVGKFSGLSIRSDDGISLKSKEDMTFDNASGLENGLYLHVSQEDLVRVCGAWAELPTAIRTAILAMIDAVQREE